MHLIFTIIFSIQNVYSSIPEITETMDSSTQRLTSD